MIKELPQIKPTRLHTLTFRKDNYVSFRITIVSDPNTPDYKQKLDLVVAHYEKIHQGVKHFSTVVKDVFII
jgi:hypothetical protein